jgi:dihydroflavonol-4-reductase
MAETVLVTGGTGFVGGWCIAELLKRGYDVRTTVRSLAKADGVRAAVATEVDPGERLGFAAADLSDDAGWAAAMAGCDYVLHVASPLGRENAPEEALIGPARDGAVRVLRAAREAGVKRVVMTSSTAACAPPTTTKESLTDETLWTDPADDLTGYRRSKVLAERAAWDFMAGYEGPTELTTVLPSAVFGPILIADGVGSVMVIGRLMNGKMVGNPRLGFSVVDVRDLAIAHILAMTAPEAAGERFIAAGDYMWMAEISQTLRARLGDAAAKVPTRRLPDVVLKLAALRDPSVAQITPGLGRKIAFSSAKAQQVLGWRPRPATDTVVDCAASLLAFGVV